ncbi:hypothetical protein KDA_18860 [Dictyobacter alpinus]|uniref:Uncharacterized protein n=1 Tax=Dictyobacter alpinus TaxID=2014873 RepID=A0A402B4Z2_9CHLR|nr:hypothetical protein KDA_18860 [Dictyobacter alpinus]
MRPEERSVLEYDEIGLTATVHRAQKQLVPQMLQQKNKERKEADIPLAELIAYESASR